MTTSPQYPWKSPPRPAPVRPPLAAGTRIRIKPRCQPYYGAEYQGELTIAAHGVDDYGRRFYRFEEFPDPTVSLMEFQIENEFDLISR